MNREPAHSISKRGRPGEGRPTKRTPEVVARIAEAIAIGLTDEEASLLAGINPDTMNEWRKDPEFSEAIKRGTAERLLMRLERIEDGLPPARTAIWSVGKEPRLCDGPAAKQPGATDSGIILWVMGMTGRASTSSQRQERI
jgi:hypothetical protein